MEYGQTISPKSFIDNRPQFFTKQGFANYMARALQTVGMIPLSVNSYDLADPANAERDPGVSENCQFWFDYPTNEDFRPDGVNGVPYRPCLGLSNSLYRAVRQTVDQWIGGTVAYAIGHNVGFKHYRRRADRLSRADFTTHRAMYNGGVFASNYGLLDNDRQYNYIDGEGGCWTGSGNWKLFSSWGDVTQQNMLFINRVFVHLGKAGLVVQVGTHPTRRAETCNVLNFAALFAGGRIPGRARAAGLDTLRDTLDPVFFVDLGTTYSSNGADIPMANGGNLDIQSAGLGGARTVDGVFTPMPVSAIRTMMRSIDYLDDAMVNNAPGDVYPRPSPTIVNGNGVHLLHRALMFPFNQCGTTIYMGRVDSTRAPNLIGLTKWEDVYYFPGLALGDRVMTPGRKVDPNTGKNWYSIWANPRQQSFALDYDGASESFSPTAGATVETLMSTTPLDLTGAGLLIPSYSRYVVRDTAQARGMVTDAVAGTFAPGITLRVGQYEHSNIDAVMRWTKAAGTNEFLLSNWGWVSWDNTKYFNLVFELEGLVPSAGGIDFYTVTYEYFCRASTNNVGDPANANNNYEMQTDVAAGSLRLSTDNGTERYISARAGSPAFQNVYWNYASYGDLANPLPVGATNTYRTTRRIYADASGRATIRFQMMHNYGSAGTTLSLGVKNVVLKRYQRG